MNILNRIIWFAAIAFFAVTVGYTAADFHNQQQNVGKPASMVSNTFEVDGKDARIFDTQALADELNAKVMADDLNPMGISATPVANASCGTVDGRLAIARQAMNDIGGDWVCLAIADIVCNDEMALACASPDGVVTVTSNMDETMEYWFWVDIMLHEYAHQIHFLAWDSLHSSDGFDKLFNGDEEHLADCMAEAVMEGHHTGYGYKCSDEQLAYSTDAWAGVFA